ncbi:FAD-dependent oxidoreductase [Kosmotoga pacifica]|uniref:Electron transfer flavoprotein n=1 Tax=Kosmotoga pacifica TaxID=1330330 RepID=A0A0G2ZDM7_9BACT|nr:FAD-dependent oxidoreductase [Kosmotoga pacifica]AKI97644.1 electron transfer flavoprotein [Kosmotoga pacifica]
MNEHKKEFDVVVIGAGPAGLAAAYVLAKAGINVIVFEKGEYPGSKNVMGGVLYSNAMEKLVPEFYKEAKVERNIIEQNMWLLGDNSLTKIGHKNKTWVEKPNAFTVLRANFDRWFASKVEAAGALIIPKTKVEDFLRDGSGKIVGVRTTRPNGDVYAKAVIIAEGVNPILTMKAGLRDKDLKSNMAAIAVKELIEMPEEVINDRFNVTSDQGATIELLGSWSKGLFGLAFIYTNRKTVSVGCGVFIEDIKKSGMKPYELLESLKNHPAVKDLLGEEPKVMEYMAHLIPEGGYHAMPRFYDDNVLACGDAAMMVNSIHREGSNYALTSGRFAAETLIEAFDRGDFSKRTLKIYEEKLRESFIIKDLLKYKDLPRTLEKNPQLVQVYPDLVNDAFGKFLTVDGTSKWDLQKEIIDEVRRRRGIIPMVNDLFKLWKAVR